MSNVIDLEGFTFLPSSDLYAIMLRQGVAIRADAPQTAYSVYADSCHAAAEVAYSRLCKLIGVPCVDARFAVNLRAKNAPVYVSASAINPLWSRYSLWNDTHSPAQKLDNPNQLEQHRMLRRISHNSMPDLDGFVLGPNSYFIAANNGASFFSQSLAQSIIMRQKGVSETLQARFEVPNVSAILSDINWQGDLAEELMRSLGKLTDEQLRNICDFPEGSVFDETRAHILPRLVALRNAGIRVGEALDDLKDE